MGGRGAYSEGRKKKVLGTGGNKGQTKAHPMDIDEFQGKTLQEIEDSSRGLKKKDFLR